MTTPAENATTIDTSRPVADRRPPTGWGRTLRRLVMVCLFLLVAFLSRALWLPFVAYPLLAPPPKHLNEVTRIWLHTHDGHTIAGDMVIEQTANLLKSHPDAKVIFTQGWSSRLVEIGVIPPPVEMLRKALAKYQIGPERVIHLDVQGYQFWNEARAMDAYLSQHPKERVLFLTEEFGGRSHQLVLRSAISAENRDRVEILGLPDPRYSCHNWWKSRAGVKGVMVGYLYLIHTIVQPHPEQPVRRLSLADFEKAVPDPPESNP